jgi:hypothetical protein
MQRGGSNNNGDDRTNRASGQSRRVDGGLIRASQITWERRIVLPIILLRFELEATQELAEVAPAEVM